MRDDSIPVTLNNISLVWLKNPDGSGALAFPEHVDEDGEVRFAHCFSESYAHTFSDGRILRYGKQIGRIDDLIPSDSPAVCEGNHE